MDVALRKLLLIPGVLVLAVGGCIPPGEQLNDPPIQSAKPMQQPETSPAAAESNSPDTFRARFETTKGSFVIEVHRSWAPIGAGRFYELVRNGFYDDCAFFRVLPGFMAQTGINGDPAIQAKWRNANIPDDALVKSNQRGFVTFAKAGPNTRSTQIFINFGDNRRLDGMGFPPFGQVVEGMDVVDSITTKYGEKPDQSQIQYQGNAYLKEKYPGLDYIKTARIIETDTAEADATLQSDDAEKQAPDGEE